jgi:hypothetical protein
VNDQEVTYHHLPEPPTGHPDRALIWEAEQALQSISALAENPDIRNAFSKRLDEFRAGLEGAALLVLGTEHSIAFIGDIGVGKTTALCRVVGLEIPTLDVPTPVLETGGGGTTICEVHITNGPEYALTVEPRSEDELRKEVREFARLMKASSEPGVGDETTGAREDDEKATVAREIVTAIRNMSGLRQEIQRNPDGTISGNIDHARSLAEKLKDADAVADAIWTRMEIWKRTSRELLYSDASDKEPLAWLQESFRMLNLGRNPDFSLPRRIGVALPQRMFDDKILSIQIVDTKGIDGIAEREDLAMHFGEPNTIAVLCSGFNDAPATSVQRLLERAQEAAYPDLETKSAILVLPKHQEARAVKDGLGDPVSNASEGYYIKGDQARWALQSAALSVVPIEFFNVFDDDTQRCREFLLERVASLREMHHTRLAEMTIDAFALLNNYENEQIKEVQRQAATHLQTWLDINQEITHFSTNVQDSLLQAIRARHHMTVRASVRRRGIWPNLDYWHELSFGARAMAANAVTPHLNDFRAIVGFLLQNPDLEDASGLLREAQRIIESGADQLLGRIQRFGRNVHTDFMEPDERFWDSCINERGQGSYRRIIAHHDRWFEGDRHQITARVEAMVQEEWQSILERVAAILVNDEDDV